MSTFMQKPADITRKWYIIDAKNKPLGRTAVIAANILRGKNKPSFTPHVDCGDHVIIINCKDAILTGNKLTQKYRYHHTGWIGNLKSIRYDKLMLENPEKAMFWAVSGMVPKNALGREVLTRLRVFKDENHIHQAQQPEIYNA